MDYGKIKVSVIVPIVNCEVDISLFLEKLSRQTIDKEKMQVILLINNGNYSDTDDYDTLKGQYPYIQIYYVDTDSLSQVCNIGIELSKGRYITFLHPSDSFSDNALESLIYFFDKNYDETDAVTFKLIPMLKGVRRKPSYTYSVFKKDGIYDLNGEAKFSALSFTNILVKNKNDANVLFDSTKDYNEARLMYCLNVVSDKMKVGFVSGCEYLYDQNVHTSCNELSDPEVYETSFIKWEEIFSQYDDRVPEYVQALYFDYLYRRFRADTLLPYHLSGKEYEFNIERMRKMLAFVSDEIIKEHPDCCEETAYYFIDFKYNSQIKSVFGDKLTLTYGEEVIYESESIKLKLTKFKFKNDMLEVCGYIYSPVFSYCEKPVLVMRTKSNEVKYPELIESSFCYKESKVKNNQAWAFRCTLDTTSDIAFSFKVEIGSESYGVEISTGEWVAFNKTIDRNEFVKGTKYCKLTDTRIVVKNVDNKAEKKYLTDTLISYLRRNIKVFVVRFLCLLLPCKNEIWLYHDCKTAGKDNGYQQYIHDADINDGVKRYYVVNGSVDAVKDIFTSAQRKNLVAFRSWKHKLLYLKASKIITAFIEKVNYLPFYDDVYMHYTDIFNADVIYLQHGVLHAHLPWKYSYERLDLAAEVVSTYFEVENLTKNYSFPQSALIKSKMPRYDFVDTDVEPQENRVLFAPSWRKYLITLSGDGSWIADKQKFMDSDYYKKTAEFLNSPELAKILEENDWYLDFKMHPIFSVYNDCFDIINNRISTHTSKETYEYKAVITDYSSFVFDFIYLGRAVIYFMPDYKQFLIGLNDYKELDIPFENGFGEFTQDAQSAVWALEKIIKNDGNPIPPFDDKTDGFFFDQEKDCREKIYKAIKD